MKVERSRLTVFILCAGSGERWNDYFGVPKQLIPFGGEPLLARTVRQIEAMAIVCDLYCVTRDPRIVLESHQTLKIRANESLAETILETSQYWSLRNVFLLGDVFYSERSLSLILRSTQDLAFYGRPWPSAYVKCGHGELFGASFSARKANLMKRFATAVVAARREGLPGNLWNVYQAAAGLQFGSSHCDRRLLVAIDDYTNDLDTPVDYERRGALYERIASGRHRRMLPLLHKLTFAPRHVFLFLRWFLARDRRRRRPHTGAAVVPGTDSCTE